MRLQRVLEIVYHRPWLITPSAHAEIRSLIERKVFGSSLIGGTSSVSSSGHGDSPDKQELVPPAQASLLDLFINARPEASVDDNGIGHVHVTGPIGVGLSQIEKQCGSTDTADMLGEAQQMISDGAGRLLLHIDSPGGMVGGTPEAAETLSELDIPWFAYVGPGQMAASAAYYLAAGADKIYASPTAEIGSIGVYLPWVDRTAAFEQQGYKVELITNKEGDLKGTGFPGTSLSEVQREDLQKGVQQVFEMFAGFVRDNRPGAVSDDTMRGQSFFAAEARNRHLIDGVASYEAAYRTLLNYRR